MTTAAPSIDEAPPTAARHLGGPAGMVRDIATIAWRAMRQVPREPESLLPAIFIPAFFYVVNLGQLETLAHSGTGINYKDFLLPMAVTFAVTGVSRAPALVTDIQNGYFDRLCLTPIRRISLLLGHMMADIAVVMALCVPVLVLGFAIGVRFASGPGGVLAFVGIAGLWGLAFTGFPYAVALKTGNPAAVSATFVLFFPFAFLTDAVVPKEALTGWFSTIASWNPVTYVLGALRSLVLGGWQATPLLEGLAAIGGIAFVSVGLSLLALRGRIRRGS